MVIRMRRGWNLDPVDVISASRRTGVTAALWTYDGTATQDLEAPATNSHIVSLHLSSHDAELFLDNKPSVPWTQFQPGLMSLCLEGRQPRAVITGPFRVLHFYVPHGLVEELAEAGGASRRGRVVELVDPGVVHDAVIERVGGHVLEEMAERLPLSQLRVDALGQEVTIALLRRHSTIGQDLADAPVRGGLAPWQLKRVTGYLRDELAKDVRLADLAALTRLSVFHFSRAFKQSTGLPPHRWQLKERMLRARDLLEATDLPIARIALQVGYDDAGQFATTFRKIVGISPSGYRRDRRT